MVEFVKLTERCCLARATRSDGAIVETTATAKGGIPHDLEHFLVEQELRCDTGFWARVSQGAEFSNFRVIRKGPLRHSRARHHELTKGYAGWDEDLITKVVDMYREARRQGWSPPASVPSVPTMALLLDPRRRPPTQATFDRRTLTAAAFALHSAEQEWQELPVGRAVSRRWAERQPSRRAPTARRRAG